MRRSCWTLASLAVLAAGLLAFPAHAAAPLSVVSDEALGSSVVERINTVRRARGLAPVRASTLLKRAAAGHTRAMATHGFFAHESRDGTPFWKRIARSYPSRGFRYWTVGETVLFSSDGLDGAAAVRMWLQSPPHRRVLLSPQWREIGVAAVNASGAPGDFGGDDVTLVTADFGVRR